LFGYYLIIIALGIGNLVLAIVAYLQRRTQIKENALRERQIDLAEHRNDLAAQRLARLSDQVALLTDIRAALRQRSNASDGSIGAPGATEGSPAAPSAPGRSAG
jgi:hypothetical protein